MPRVCGAPAFQAEQRDGDALFAYPSPYRIMGQGALSAEEMAAWLCQANADIDADFAREFAALYIIEAALEGVSHDVAFSQMCLETGFLRFDRLVTPDMNNFGGLGALNMSYRGERFSSIQKGVRAQIQHLKAYGSTQALAQELVDPRYYYVRYGSAPTIHDLSGKWATDALYGDKLKSIIDRAYFMAGKNAVSPILSSGQ
ncbi:MAG: glucosaminidase domain-containing protein [Spirochaetaceae bacterium]|nr:glucosaminidase domain-containing protein [Spirochaetaceae bacterium]